MDKKHIVITGACGALGVEITKHFLKKNFNVSTIDLIPFDSVNNPELHNHYECDLTSEKNVKNTFSKICNSEGVPDVLLNLAGWIYNQPIISMSNGEFITHGAESWEKSFKTNVDTAFYCSKSCISSLLGVRKKGVIVNFSSVSAAGNAGQIAYSSSKSALCGMSNTIGKEVGPFGIRCVSLSLGFIEVESTKNSLSDQKLKEIINKTPLKKLGSVGNVVSAIEFIIENDFLNATSIDLDGGLVL